MWSAFNMCGHLRQLPNITNMSYGMDSGIGCVSMKHHPSLEEPDPAPGQWGGSVLGSAEGGRVAQAHSRGAFIFGQGKTEW